ncbi:MAG: helix-turn-helix transcriptional regulator [Bacteroidales bacterium]|nr:helix-turn-helix transcriptional regulator [Bacteroidales bacterium]MDD4670903.1 helix-turn-helix transcriptional regulator [Bacteroidales bacterium]
MNKRIQRFLELEDLTPAKFADIMGIQRSSVSHILAERNKPSFDFIEKMLLKFPNINAEWLILGKGRPYKETYPRPELVAAHSENTIYRQDVSASRLEPINSGQNGTTPTLEPINSGQNGATPTQGPITFRKDGATPAQEISSSRMESAMSRQEPNSHREPAIPSTNRIFSEETPIFEADNNSHANSRDTAIRDLFSQDCENKEISIKNSASYPRENRIFDEKSGNHEEYQPQKEDNSDIMTAAEAAAAANMDGHTIEKRDEKRIEKRDDKRDENIIDKRDDKRIARITVFYSDGTFEER